MSYTVFPSELTHTNPRRPSFFITDEDGGFEEVLEIGPGERFIPDHDQRNVGAFGVTYQNRESGFWAALYGRHESGTPLEVDDDDLDDVRARRGAELVDFDRMRVKPRTLFDVSVGIDLFWLFRTRQVGRGPTARRAQFHERGVRLQFRESVQRNPLRNTPGFSASECACRSLRIRFPLGEGRAQRFVRTARTNK